MAVDALLVILCALDDYRGDSQFWTWARRFAHLEVPVSIHWRMGRDRLAPDPECLRVSRSRMLPPKSAEIQELLRKVIDLIDSRLTRQWRTV